MHIPILGMIWISTNPKTFCISSINTTYSNIQGKFFFQFSIKRTKKLHSTEISKFEYEKSGTQLN